MRTAILGLAIMGALGSGFLGLVWVADAGKAKEAMKLAESLGVADSPEVKAAMAKARSAVTAAYLLLLGAVAATVATVMLVKRPDKVMVWGGVLIACAALPALFAMKSLVFTFFLAVAGGLCLAGKFPAPQPQPALTTA